LTDINYLNDKEEYKKALEYIIKYLNGLANSNDDLINKIIDKVTRIIFANAYVMSFTKDSDLLSQWRGYSNSNGYSIEFNSTELFKVIQENKGNIYLFKCLYDDNEQQRIVKEMCDTTINYIRGFEKDDKTDKVELFATVVSLIAPKFKNSQFHEEHERRIIYSDDFNNMVNIETSFRKKNGYLIPFKKLKVNIKEPNLIKSITIFCPGSEQMLIKGSLERYLASNGIKTTVKISQIPFRQI
jgi:hypothetical protein